MRDAVVSDILRFYDPLYCSSNNKKQTEEYESTNEIYKLFDIPSLKYLENVAPTHLGSGSHAFVDELMFSVKKEEQPTMSRLLKYPFGGQQGGSLICKISAALKSSLGAEKDNLIYEFRVGLYINKLNQLSPFFLETFGLLEYEDDDTRINMLREPSIKALRANPGTKVSLSINGKNADGHRLATDLMYGSVSKGLNRKRKEPDKNCKSCELYCILSEYSGPSGGKCPTFENVFTKERDLYNMLCALFHVYSALYGVASKFTHNDLHSKNVLIVKKEKPIKFVHHFKEELRLGTLELYTNYVPKIIDHGRAYCEEAQTDPILPNCSNLSAVPRVANKSKDLWLLQIASTYPEILCSKSFQRILKLYNYELDVKFSEPTTKDARDGFLVVEQESDEQTIYDTSEVKTIKNVDDAFFALIRLLSLPQFQRNMTTDTTVHIYHYDQRPMELKSATLPSRIANIIQSNRELTFVGSFIAYHVLMSFFY